MYRYEMKDFKEVSKFKIVTSSLKQKTWLRTSSTVAESATIGTE